MDRQSSGIESEISLGAYINIIGKRKKIILSVFSVFAAVTVLMWIITPKMYKATTLIMIMPSKAQGILASDNIAIGFDHKSGPNNYTIPTHEALLKTNVVLEKVIDRLDLKDVRGVKLNPSSIADALNVKQTKDTNILELTAEASSAKKAAELSNAWAQEYERYNQALISGQVKGTVDFVADQFEIAKQNLAEVEGKINDFKDKYKVDLMKAELDMKKAKLNRAKKELMDLEIILKTKEDSLKELRKEFAKQEKFIVVSKAITDDALWQKSSAEENASDMDKKKLKSEEINPIYRNLETRIVDTEIELNTLRPGLEYLRQSVIPCEKEIDELDKTINKKELELVQLNRQVEIYKKTYHNLSNKIEDARIAKAEQFGEVKMVSPALIPQYSTRSKKMQNCIAICFFGLVCGLSSAFIMEFFDNLKKGTGR